MKVSSYNFGEGLNFTTGEGHEIKISSYFQPYFETKQYTEAKTALYEIEAGLIPDLIITDLNMPVMNGLEFTQALRNFTSTKRTPILMLTTETNAELKKQGKALGLTGWIVKPFNPAQLKQAINRVLRLSAS